MHIQYQTKSDGISSSLKVGAEIGGMRHFEDTSLDVAHDEKLQNLENCHCFGDGFG
jgi:hypothetical protein